MSVRVLHLVGSPTSEPFFELSLVYARACIDALVGERRYTFIDSVGTPDGFWRFPSSLAPGTIAAAEPMDLPTAMARVVRERVDIGCRRCSVYPE